MAESYLNRIIKTGDTPNGYVRPAGIPNGESIIENAPVITQGGINYYPIYYICAMDTFTSASFSKTGTGVSTGADAYVFSDEPSTLYVGDTTHTFNVANDYTTSENWKCRYVIAYATEANKNVSTGITVNLYSYRATFEFIGSSYLILSSSSALFGDNTASNVNQNLRYVNLSNSNFYNNTISISYFCQYCLSLESILLPSITSISGGNFCFNCGSLKSISLPALTSISGNNFCYSCGALKNISLPALTSIDGNSALSSCTILTDISLPVLTNINGNSFCAYCIALKSISLPILTNTSNSFCSGCNVLTDISLPALISINGNSFCSPCYSLEYFKIPNTITSIINTSTSTLPYTQFIELPTNFNIDACNFTGATGYNKSLAWFTHLATQLKDNSGGTAKTMVLGATNIALIPSATATIISNKNWTLS